MGLAMTDALHCGVGTERTLASVRVNLKSGEYDGVDIMRAWLAIDDLIALKRQLTAAQSDVARLTKGNRKCAATLPADPPMDCDFPFCGCDPVWQDVIKALQECGWHSKEEWERLTGERDAAIESKDYAWKNTKAIDAERQTVIKERDALREKVRAIANHLYDHSYPRIGRDELAKMLLKAVEDTTHD